MVLTEELAIKEVNIARKFGSDQIRVRMCRRFPIIHANSDTNVPEIWGPAPHYPREASIRNAGPRAQVSGLEYVLFSPRGGTCGEAARRAVILINASIAMNLVSSLPTCSP